jgi:phosphoribosylglycinamide formyltransferase-1
MFFPLVLTMTRIAIFASGAGSNAAKIIDYFRSHQDVAVALVVSNKPGAGVITIAEKEKIPVLIIDKEQFFRGDGYVPFLRSKNIDFIVLAGFLWKIPSTILSAYSNSIINIHPALLPKYGGKGMYGLNVHASVLSSGDHETGITIHYVDEHYDNGDVIFQEKCDVSPADTPETLAEKVHKLEHKHFPRVIEQVVNLRNK